MSFFFIYLLKAALGISLIYALYRIFLKKHTKFQANRIFLLTFLCLALLYPFLNFNLNLQPGTSLADGYSFVESLEDEWMVWQDEREISLIANTANESSSLTPASVFWLIYALGLGVIAIPILTSWAKLFQLIKRSSVSHQSGIRWVKSSESQSFSAFNYIFIGKELQDLSQEDQRRVIKHEEVHALYLDSKNHILKEEKLFTGTVNTSAVYPREVIKKALDAGATSLVLVHNHPSGDPSPSVDDIKLTANIAAAAKQLDIDLYDHIIIGNGLHYSFKDHNQL